MLQSLVNMDAFRLSPLPLPHSHAPVAAVSQALGHSPLHVQPPILIPLGHSLAPRISSHPLHPSVQQPVRLCYVMHIGGCRTHAMHYSGIGVHADSAS